ncbi:hypothetical protein AA11237_1316 [Acidocella aminolytica 101 = DSM 11237]|nr:hypothetical protein AA11237_1316 [Acidocella aminolytica 101 = DSM 11237]
MSTGFGREIHDQESHYEAAYDRHQYNARPPRRRPGEQAGIIMKRPMAEKREIMDQPDKKAEHDSAAAGENTKPKRQGRKKRKR